MAETSLDRAAARDRFMKRLPEFRYDKTGFARYVLNFDPHAGQETWLAKADRDEDALTTGNRFGKSSVAAVDLIHACTYRDGWTQAIFDAMLRKHEPYHALNTANTADQARIVWSKASGLLQAPKAQWLVKSSTVSPFPRLTFVTGAILESRSLTRNGEHILGHTYDRVNMDEAAFAKRFDQIRENVLLNRVVDRAGRITYTSTGNGRNEYGRFFLRALTGKDPDLYAQSGNTLENTYIPRERVLKNIERMSPRMRQQTIEGAIIDGGGDYFPPEDLAEAYQDAYDAMLVVHERDDEDLVSHAELFPDAKEDGGTGPCWRERYPNHKYITGWDIADKKDWTVGITLDVSVRPFLVVEFERFHQRGWKFNFARMIRRDHKYGARTTKFDSTGIGDVATDDLKELDPNMRAEGFNFAGGGKKDALLTNLQTALSLRQVAWPDIPPLRDEMSFYERDDKGLVKDCVMSLAIAMWFAKTQHESTFSFTSVSAKRRAPPESVLAERVVLRAPKTIATPAPVQSQVNAPVATDAHPSPSPSSTVIVRPRR